MQTLVENVFNSPARVRVFSHNGVDFLFFFLFLCLKGGPPPLQISDMFLQDRRPPAGAQRGLAVRCLSA